MSEVLLDTSTAAVITALDANWRDYIRTFQFAADVELHDAPELLWFITGIPAGSFNAVQYTNLPAENAKFAIEQVINHYKQRQTPLGWLVGPNSQPPHLDQLLEAQSLRPVAKIPVMAIDISKLAAPSSNPPGFSLQQVEDVQTLQQWIAAELQGFEVAAEEKPGLTTLRESIGLHKQPALSRYLGWLDGEPVATVTLLLSAGVAGIYDVSTIPPARRQGIGTAITKAALEVARQQGYRVGILQATPEGLEMYRRLGFQIYSTYTAYA